ncbi:uncharacterized protein LOC131155227 isoform X2 [Malania oleifera]|uniref:uncharacterized protein LOC131155227 isoform X2 n=1 Tax=Malania oleifera TaxID=397392 RepID=UPI0025AEA337|nr:uncharacterized protein LOC131155227 isoform X2 [Malania oleifera]
MSKMVKLSSFSQVCRTRARARTAHFSVESCPIKQTPPNHIPYSLSQSSQIKKRNASLEAAVNWIIDHEGDLDIDQMPLVTVNISIDDSTPADITEEVKIKAQLLRGHAHKTDKEEEKRSKREREKRRIQAGKELLESKHIAEENERKRSLALRKAEKEEEKRAREKIRQKLRADKAERRNKLGLPLGDPGLLCVKYAAKEPMRDCLRSLKLNCKDDDARVKRAFQTLLIYVRNVANNPNEEKFRMIRLGNQAFKKRVGDFEGGVEFLELCGFERTEGGKFLILPRNKVDMAVLNAAASVLNSAITNPFFGYFQRTTEDDGLV